MYFPVSKHTRMPNFKVEESAGFNLNHPLLKVGGNHHLPTFFLGLHNDTSVASGSCLERKRRISASACSCSDGLSARNTTEVRWFFLLHNLVYISYIYIHIYIYLILMYVYVYIYIYVYLILMYVYMYIYIHIYYWLRWYYATLLHHITSIQFHINTMRESERDKKGNG